MQPFTIFLGLGTLTGLLLVSWRAPQKEIIRYLDAGMGILLGALIVSRAFTVIINFPYYQSHPGEILQVWLGGLSSIGAITGGLLSLVFIAWFWKFPTGLMADTFLPLAGTLTVSAWLGCWVDRCGYGWPYQAWWALPGRDVWGALTNRIPVQLMGAILTLAIVWLLDRMSKHLPRPGMSGATGMFAISTGIFILSFLRADPTPIWQGLRIEAWGALGLMIVSILIVVVLLIRWKLGKSDSHRLKTSSLGSEL